MSTKAMKKATAITAGLAMLLVVYLIAVGVVTYKLSPSHGGDRVSDVIAGLLIGTVGVAIGGGIVVLVYLGLTQIFINVRNEVHKQLVKRGVE
jgi:uncharacterized membrane protein YqhA